MTPDDSTREPWTDDRENRLRRMLAAGCSRQEIALALNTTTRAVQGKLQRLGLQVSRNDAYSAAMVRAQRAKER